MAQILCFGASIVQGYADQAGGWTQRLRQVLDQKYTNTYRDLILPKYDVFNLGISGNTSEDLLKRVEQEIIPRNLEEIAAIIISIGVNDSIFELNDNSTWSTPEQYQQNLKQIFAIAKKYTPQVTFLGLTPCDESKTKPMAWSDIQESYSNERLKLFNDAAKAVCTELEIKFIELFEIFPKEFIYDGIHPNSQGHQFIAEQVLQNLELEQF